MATKKRGKRKRSSARRGGKRRRSRKSYGTVRLRRPKRRSYRLKGGKLRLNKRGRRSRKTSFKLRNPLGALSPKALRRAKRAASSFRGRTTVSGGGGGVSPAAVKSAKRSIAARKGARTRAAKKARRRAAAKRGRRKKSHGKRRHGRRHGRKHGRIFRGRVAHVTLRRRKKVPLWKKRALAKHGFITKGFKLRNPGRHRRKRNPDGIVGVLIEKAKATVTSPRFWISSAEVVVGMGATAMAPAAIEYYSKGRLRNVGPQGVLLSAVSAGAIAGLGGVVEYLLAPPSGLPHWSRGLAWNLGLGGGATTLVRAAFEFFPKAAEFLKLSPVRTPVYGPVAVPMPMAVAPSGAGVTGMGGLGAVDAGSINEALIAGESFARSVSQFNGMGDWMELRGMGDWMELRGMGGNPRVPYADIRSPGQLLAGYPGQYGGGGYDPYGAHRRLSGMGGFGDWVEALPGSEVADDQFQPAMETF